MLESILANRHALIALRKVFSRGMPYGTYLEVDDDPASLRVIYKGEPVWTVTQTDAGPELITKLSNGAQEDILSSFQSLLPNKVLSNA